MASEKIWWDTEVFLPNQYTISKHCNISWYKLKTSVCKNHSHFLFFLFCLIFYPKFTLLSIVKTVQVLLNDKGTLNDYINTKVGCANFFV